MKLPLEGVLSGVAPFKLTDVTPPPVDNECWKEAGRVEELFIYPGKSMRGISVKSAEVYLDKSNIILLRFTIYR